MMIAGWMVDWRNYGRATKTGDTIRIDHYIGCRHRQQRAIALTPAYSRLTKVEKKTIGVKDYVVAVHRLVHRLHGGTFKNATLGPPCSPVSLRIEYAVLRASLSKKQQKDNTTQEVSKGCEKP